MYWATAVKEAVEYFAINWVDFFFIIAHCHCLAWLYYRSIYNNKNLKWKTVKRTYQTLPSHTKIKTVKQNKDIIIKPSDKNLGQAIMETKDNLKILIS
jgi:hypothetical protein